jgi:hypothetical protein
MTAGDTRGPGLHTSEILQMRFSIRYTNRLLDDAIQSYGSYSRRRLNAIMPALASHTVLPFYCQTDASLCKIWRCLFLSGGELTVIEMTPRQAP